MNPCALGWDNHRKFSKVSLMERTPDGEIRAVERARLEHHDRQAMRAWLSHLDPEIPVALEATFGWPWVADLMEELGHPVHLAHPPAIRALAKHEAKTDRCDGDRLGKFQLRGILPESYLAPPEVRQSSAKVAVAHQLSKLVYVVWAKRVPYSDTPPPRPGSRQGQREPKEPPTAKTALRSDQPRHPMVRRRATVGQTRK